MKKWKVTLACVFASLMSLGQQDQSPKLVVGIVVDQMCYEYLYRYYDKYCEGGFKRFMNNGTNCRNTNYNYVPTYTGPGHASIYTGTTPSDHGIVANEWYSRHENKEVNCVEDTAVNTIGSESAYGKYSPQRLKSNTITDQLKLTYPKAKVVSMSIKNRGAILPGGHLSDGSYWFDFETGQLISSTFFATELPNWVQKFNKRKYPEKCLKEETWNTLLPIEEYHESLGDDRKYERLLVGKETPTFPYNLKAMTNDSLHYGLFTSTPFANTYLTDFALKAIENEDLGTDGQTDMLCISYSTPDIIGHSFGPYSIEIEDTYLRLDLEVKRLLQTLDSNIGKGEYIVFITADHAVVPVPQFLTDKGLPGGYVFMDSIISTIDSLCELRFGARLLEHCDNLNMYLNNDRIDSLGLQKNDVVAFFGQHLIPWKGIKRVFTTNELYEAGKDHGWKDMIRRGIHHRESGDIVVMLEPGYLPKLTDSEEARKGTSHGSAYGYDTHVPLLWYGKGIEKQEVFRNINITDISATLIHMLYLQRPNAMSGQPIVELLPHGR